MLAIHKIHNPKKPRISKKYRTAAGDDVLHHLAFDNSLQPNIITIVSNGKIISANPAACKLLGYSKKELLTKTRSAIFDINESSFKKMLKQRTAKGHSRALVSAIKKSGKLVPCEITSSVFMDEGGIEKSITSISDMTAGILKQKNIDTKKEKLVAENIVHAIAKQIDIDWDDEYRFRSADGSYKYVFDRGSVLFNAKGKPFRMISAMTDITERKRLEVDLMAHQLNQQKLITEVTIRAQEKERNELGRELHDNINQILATVKMYLGMVKADQTVTEDLVEKSYEYVSVAMQEIRKLSHSLMAPSLGDFGLKEALRQLAEDTNLLNGLQVRLFVDEKDNEKNIDKSKELMLYRIVQEQLTNITKYAGAKEAFITLKTDKGNLFLSVADNGVGFDSTQKSTGIGLKNISSRVKFYSGNMNIISAPGQGCILEVYIPC
ncbi:MAG: PAS domain-containing protein [Chitinophagaceae bacterium]